MLHGRPCLLAAFNDPAVILLHDVAKKLQFPKVAALGLVDQIQEAQGKRRSAKGMMIDV